MNGEVGFRSAPDRGSEFWVEILADVREETSPDAGEVRAGTASRAFPRRHVVLCVEDNPANIVVMPDLMSTIEDIDFVAVPTAKLGVELARARRPELVRMDINLSGMGGLDAVRAQQNHDETRQIPVIALTAAASERDRQPGMEAG